MTEQKYEDYWKLTLGFTDIYGANFHNYLKIIINFIDENNITEQSYKSALYEQLQKIFQEINPSKNDASIRKEINQFVKLGFIKHKLAGYHPKAKSFLKANNEEQKIIFSEIVYNNAAFMSSVTKFSNENQMNFLIKTLSYSGPLTKQDRIALIYTDIPKQKKDFLTRDEIEKYKKMALISGFDTRKYNQINYLTNILSNLTDVFLDNDKTLYLSEEDIPINNFELEKRDPYLHRLYKASLKEESKQVYKKELCYMEKLDYPSLVASHIKPFRNSRPNEQYDKDNGFLLSRGMDALFDKGYISFSDEGNIILSNRLSNDVCEHLKNYSIDKKLLNENRLKYLKYNREHIFQ